MWIALASSSALFSAAAAVTQKKILTRMHALEFSFLVSCIILVFSLFIPWSADLSALSAAAVGMILVKSLLSGLAFLFVMISLERNPISTALPLLGLTPAITALTAMLLLGEMLHAWEWFGLALMMAGIYILESRPSENLMQPLRTLAVSRRHRFIYAALLLFAVSSTIDKLLVSGYKIDPWAILFYQHIIYCIVFGTFLIVRKKSFGPMIRAASSQWAFIVVVAILTIAYRFTQLKATALAPVALVLAVKRTSIVYASFFGGKLFSDERLGRKIVGAVLIVAAGFIILRNVG